MRSYSMTLISVTVAIIALGTCYARATESSSGLPVVIPIPRHMAWAESAAPGWLALNAIKAITAPPACRDATGGITQFNARLRELNARPLDIRTNASADACASSRRLGNGLGFFWRERSTSCLAYHGSSSLKDVLKSLILWRSNIQSDFTQYCFTPNSPASSISLED